MKNICFTLCIAIVIYSNQAFGAEKGMPQLNTEFWSAQIFWLILVFSSLYIIIWKVFLPKIVNGIENRKSRIVKNLNETQKLKENAEKKLNEYNKIIENSKKEAKKIFEESKKKLDKDIEIKKKKFSEEIEKELAMVESEIKNLKKNSLTSVNHIAVNISASILQKIVGSETNTSKIKAVVDEISKNNIGKNL